MLVAGRIEDPQLAQEMSDINHAAFGYKQIRSLSRYQIQKMMKDKQFAFYGTTNHRGLVGFLCLDYMPDEYIESQDDILISNFSVLPWMQGKGIGRSILDTVVNKLYPRKNFILYVDTNNKAVRLYEKIGFINYGASYAVRSQDYIAMGLIRKEKHISFAA